jgi:hypothetical protein
VAPASAAEASANGLIPEAILGMLDRPLHPGESVSPRSDRRI